MSTLPFLSIVMPTYNSVQTTRRMLDSILTQSFRDLEVLCVDDASTDGTLDLLRQYVQRDTRVRILALPRNAGAGAARNLALEHVRGTYLRFVDADDQLPQDSLKVLCYCAQNSGVDVVKGQKYSWSHAHKGLRPNIWPDLTETTHKAENAAFSTLPQLWGCFDHQCALLRTKMVLSSGAKYATASNFQDPPFMAMIYARAQGISAFPDNVYISITQGNSLSRKIWKLTQYLDMLNGIERVFSILHEHCPPEVLIQNASKTAFVLAPRMLRAAHELSKPHLSVFLDRIAMLRTTGGLPLTRHDDTPILREIFDNLLSDPDTCVPLLLRCTILDILPNSAQTAEIFREELAALKSSLSWRVTAPLRRGLRLLRGY